MQLGGDRERGSSGGSQRRSLREKVFQEERRSRIEIAKVCHETLEDIPKEGGRDFRRVTQESMNVRSERSRRKSCERSQMVVAEGTS